MDLRAGERAELYVAPAMAWIASFGLCALADAMLGCWVLLPIFVAGFYGGTIIIALVTYPMLSSWRGWLRRRGLIAWYLIKVGGLWAGTMVVLFLLSPWWLRWSWDGALPLQVLGCVLFVGSVAAGTWAVEDGMGEAAARRGPIPSGCRGRGERRSATPGGGGAVPVRA